MACYAPLTAWKGAVDVRSGKRSMVFSRRDAALAGSEMSLPCGQCIGCRLERSRQWAMRCLHESSLYDRNCFLTLTYDEVRMPEDGCVNVRDFQLFMKRLRKANPEDRIRFFHCGEYGENFGRPHYHACIFNFDFNDKYLWSVNNGNRLYRSASLEKLWPFGFSLIGEVTFESAAYVARYIMKKVTGLDAEEHYVDKDSGFVRTPEYITMSRGGKGPGLGGIGKGWYDRFKSDVFPHDYVVIRGKKVRPPKFYDNMYELDCPAAFADLKERRAARVDHLVSYVDRLSGKSDFIREATPDRLAVKEIVKKSRIKSLVRPMEVSA